MGGSVDLMGRPQTLGQRLELIAAARRESEMAAFLGKGFGGGRANALGGAGDQDAFAAQMKIHGIARLNGMFNWGVGGAQLGGGRRRGGQHGPGAWHRARCWSIAIGS